MHKDNIIDITINNALAMANPFSLDCCLFPASYFKNEPAIFEIETEDKI